MPTKTDPLAKFIRTTEGWITLLALAVLAVLPIVQSSVSPQLAKSLAIGKVIAVVVVICRTALKVVQVLAGVGLPPIPPSAHAQAQVQEAVDLLSKLETARTPDPPPPDPVAPPQAVPPVPAPPAA